MESSIALARYASGMRGSSSSARLLAANASSNVLRRHSDSPQALDRLRVGDPGMSLREPWVAPDGLAEELDGRVHLGVGTVTQVSLAAQVKVVGFGIARAAALDEFALLLC